MKNLIEIYDKISMSFRKPKYHPLDTNKVTVFKAKDLGTLFDKYKDISYKEGNSVFFWNKKYQYVDHVAIFPKQVSKDVNIFDVDLLHATPPTIGEAHGKLKQFSGLRNVPLRKFLSETNVYSRVIIGKPPKATLEQLNKASEIASEVLKTGKLRGRYSFYFLITNPLLFIKSVNYSDYSNIKFGNPFISSYKETGNLFGWQNTYCGDLIGKIYEDAGIPNLPKATVLGTKNFRSSTLYEDFREKNCISFIMSWNETPEELTKF